MPDDFDTSDILNSQPYLVILFQKLCPVAVSEGNRPERRGFLEARIANLLMAFETFKETKKGSFQTKQNMKASMMIKQSEFFVLSSQFFQLFRLFVK